MSEKPKLKFFDIKAKKPFETSDYEVVIKEQPKRGKKIKVAIAKSPYTGIRVARLLGPVKE